MQIFASRRARQITAAIVVMALLLGIVLFFLLEPYTSILLDPVQLRAVVQSAGPAAPVVLMLVQVVQVVIPPLPNYVTAVLSGYLFGTIWGTIYTTIGTSIGIIIAVLLSKKLGRPFVETVVHPDALHWFDDEMEEYGVPTLAVLFLLPIIPEDVLCLVAGLSRLRFSVIVVVAIVARFPGFLVINMIGDGIATQAPLTGVVLGITVLGMVLVYWYREKLETWMKKLEDDG